MTTPARRSRRRFGTVGTILRAALSLVVILPAAVLFVLDWSELGTRASFATDEHHGIQYLQALGPVVTALVGASQTVYLDAGGKTRRP